MYEQVKLVRPLLISAGICFLCCLILKLAKAYCLFWWIITYWNSLFVCGDRSQAKLCQWLSHFAGQGFGWVEVKASCCLCQPGVKSSVWGGSVSEEQVWHSAFASRVRNECSLWLSRSFHPWQAKGKRGSSVFGSFTSSTATCWHLPPPGVRQKRRMWLTVSINLLSVPSCAHTCHGLHVPPTMPRVVAPKTMFSDALCASVFAWAEQSLSQKQAL